MTTTGNQPSRDPLEQAAVLVRNVAIGGLGIALAYALAGGRPIAAAAFVIGLAVGATELVGRYRDQPTEALRTTAGIFYMALNGLVALGVTLLVATGQLGAPPTAPFASADLNSLLIGAFGGMALLRSSLLNVRIRDAEVSVGPAAMLEVVLRAADRAVDRKRAGPRALDVARIMRGIPFERASGDLLIRCTALLQNLSSDERSQLNEAILGLRNAAGLTDEAKSAAVGLLIMGVVGPDVLENAVRTLGPGMRAPEDAIDALVRQFAGFVEDRDALDQVIGLCAAYDPDPTAEARAKGLADRIRAGAFPFEPGTAGRPQGAVVIAELAKTFGSQIVGKAIATLRDIRTPPAIVAAGESTAAAAAAEARRASGPATPPPGSADGT